MKGYIAISNDAWCNYLKSLQSTKAVFWRKKAAFKALREGEYFYFLNRKPVEKVRFIVGRGKYAGWSLLSPSKAWAEHNRTLGYQDEDAFIQSIRSIYKTDDIELGCILLNEVEFFEVPVNLKKCDVDFSPYIVSGRTITDDECARLNEMIERNKQDGTSQIDNKRY